MNRILKSSNFEKSLIILISFFFIQACKFKESDAISEAKKYCDCLQKERLSGKDFFDARTKCDGEEIVRNKFFRLDYISLTRGDYILSLPNKLKDSISKFHFDFYDYVENHCCSLGIEGCDKTDSLQLKLKILNTNPQ